MIGSYEFLWDRWYDASGLLDLQHFDQPFKITEPSLNVNFEIWIFLEFSDYFVSPVRIIIRPKRSINFDRYVWIILLNQFVINKVRNTLRQSYVKLWSFVILFLDLLGLRLVHTRYGLMHGLNLVPIGFLFFNLRLSHELSGLFPLHLLRVRRLLCESQRIWIYYFSSHANEGVVFII